MGRVLALLLLLSAAARADDVVLDWSTASGDLGNIVIGIGDKVTWKWADAAQHTVTHDAGTPLFDSGTLTGMGQTFAVTFSAPTYEDQSYPFKCGFHASMRGVIVVEPNGPGDNEADCGPIPPPSGIPAEVNFAQPCSATVETTVCTPSCPPGFQRVGGTETRTCGADGTWTGTSGACQLVGCGQPPVPENFPAGADTSLYQCTQTSLGAKCGVGCPPDYVLEGPQERECLPSGLWSGGTAKCTMLPSIEVDDGFIVIKTDNTHDIKLRRGSQVWTVAQDLEHQSNSNSEIQGLKTRIQSTEGGITDLNTAKASINSRLDTQGGAITAIQTDLSSLTSKVDGVDQLATKVDGSLSTEIQRATAADTKFAEDVIALNEVLDDLSTGHLELKDLQQVHLDAATALTDALDEEESRAKAAEADLSSRIDAVVITANTAKTDAAAAKTKAEQVQSSLNDALTEINALKTEVAELKATLQNPRKNGAWLLIMKIKADTTFGYTSSAWSSANVVNDLDTTLTPNNVKYAEFNTQSFKSIRVCVGAPSGNCHDYTFSQQVDNALSLFNGPPRREGIDQAQFMKIFGNPAAKACGMQEPGFNFPIADGNQQRYGFKNNVPGQACQTSDGDDADGSIGFGIRGQDCCTCGAGYTNYFVSNNENEGRGKCFDAWIWISD